MTVTSGELDGKVALVTGAARGQGRAVAKRLAEAGCSIVGADVLVDELTSLRDDLGDAAIVLPLDVTDPTAWAAAVARSVDHFGRLDFLLNAAGIMHRKTTEMETPEAFERIWRVNCMGSFLGIQAALPALRQNRSGAIVNWSSTCGLVGAGELPAYAASKWAVRGLSKSVALELAADNIRVNAILPGPIATPMTVDPKDPSAFAARAVTPLGRVGEAEEIAELALFLVSERSAFITGAEFVIDGGHTSWIAPSSPK